MIFSACLKNNFFLLILIFFFSLSCNNLQKNESPSFADDFLAREHSIIFVGDIMLSRGVDSWMKKEGYLYPFKNIAQITNSAEITFGNLESPLSFKGKKAGNFYSFRGNPLSIKGLIYSGFDLLNLANNHIFDYAKEAFEETIELLRKYDIQTIGAGKNLLEARRPAIYNLGDSKIAFLGYVASKGAFYARDNREGVARAESAWIIEDIEKVKKDVDLVIISFHWGIEYEDYPTEYQKSLARMAVDCGADMVIGHHTHTFQGIEIYKGKLIAYSLGNFIFDQRDLKNNQSFVLKVNLKGKKLLQTEIIPIELITYPCSPRIAEGKMAQEILERLYFDSSIFGTEFDFFSGRGLLKIDPR
ncbi:MAG: CapA family protein [candidate division Zixibacteria bacterium]|nr:CapA family protein [candidate division Zixibacteria bacterium]